MKTITLYHGSPIIVEEPKFGLGNIHNDYGLGFYCTQNKEIACEWACTENNAGFVNEYSFDLLGLKTIDLSSEEYHVLNWMAVLLENRSLTINNDISKRGKKYLIEHFLPKYKNTDVVIGYRADDSYFSFARAFLNNAITLDQLKKAMMLGDLGKQIVIKSKKAFEIIKYVDAQPVEHSVYYPKRVKRDDDARKAFEKEKNKTNPENEVYLIDIIRGGWKNDDTRI